MNDPLPPIPHRPTTGHKGTFGTALVIGGCVGGGLRPRMIGAPVLSSLAAARAGAGLVRLGMPAPLLDAALSMLPSATGLALPVDGDGDLVPHEFAATLDAELDRADVVAIGPGLGRSHGAAMATLRAVGQDRVPVVADADALNNLADTVEFARELRAPMVITPHPGEFARLASAAGMRFDPRDPSLREPAARELAQRLGCVVVLKGAGSIVSDGHRAWTCTAGHPCLATAGTGDVLTGLIAGLIAQFAPRPEQAREQRMRAMALARLPEHLRALAPATASGETGAPSGERAGERAGGAATAPSLDLFDAARVGVQLHAEAGERWASSRGASAGLLATELADLLPSVIETHRGA